MAKEESTIPEPAKIDSKAPEFLKVTFTDSSGKVWGEEIAAAKHFKTGSVGFFAGGKIGNPENGEKYQMGCNIILVGSKPEQ